MADRRRTIPYEPGLDGVRAVAVVGVLLYHVFALAGRPGWFRGGNLGVSVFFTLSGFLITTLLLAEHAGNGRIDLLRFWGRRVQRLVPASTLVVVAVLLLGAADLLAVRASDVIAAQWSATNWHIIAGGSGDANVLQAVLGPLGPTWSLAVEEQFYLGLVAVVWLAARTLQPARTLAVLFAVVAAASLAATQLTDMQLHLEFGTDVRATELAAGGLLALWWRRRGSVPTARHGAVDTAGWAAAAVLLALFLLADYTPPWLLRGGFALVALLTCTVVVAVMSHGSLHRALAVRPLVAAGRWSYALYLVHWPVYLLLTAERVGFGGLPLSTVRVAAAFGVAVAVHHLVEQPLRTRPVRPTVAIAMWLVAGLSVTTAALLLG